MDIPFCRDTGLKFRR